MARSMSARIVLVAAALFAAAGPTHADGAILDGRTAPDLRFDTVVQGLSPGLHLSSLRGRVVLLRFWMRDCPNCLTTNPRVQRLHERWGDRGLVVLTVLHEFGPGDRPTESYLRANGFTFAVATDRTGELARRFGVVERPTDYVIGVDGRIKASNGAPDDVLQYELGLYRLARLGPVPEALADVRNRVWRLELADALKAVDAAARATPASAEVRAAADAVLALSREEVEALIRLADLLERTGRRAEAQAIHDRQAGLFAGTALEARTREARDEFRVRRGG
jgi:peroxiredoxin